jgi:hypothetical protein
MYQEMTGEQDPRVLVRLRLMGNFVWGPEAEPKLYLDGEGFGLPGRDRADLRLPSGNGRRGGDFEMWFWLSRQRRRIPGIGVIGGRASRFFAAAAGATSLGGQALQLAVDRTVPELAAVLPAGYEVDSTQRFNPTEAIALARRTRVTRLTGLVPDRFERLGGFLANQLLQTTRVTLSLEVVPEADVLERVKASMAAGAAPDLVIGDESLAARLQRMEFTTEFNRL